MSRQFTIAFLILCALFPGTALGQLVHFDSLLFRRPVPPSPYEKEVDSVRATLTGDPWYPVDELPELVGPGEKGKLVPLLKYFQQLESSAPAGLQCFIVLKIKWNGQISEARLVACIGQGLNTIDLRSIVQRIRVKRVARLEGWPVDVLYQISFKGRGK